MSSKKYSPEFRTEAVRQVTERGYSVTDVAREDLFDYIEMFYNHRHRHSYNGGVSTEEFEHAFKP